MKLSATDLGQLALPDFCARCFWIKQRLGNRLPFQTFPGIFSSIDSYTKKVVHGHFDATGEFPNCLSALGGLRSYVNPPHYSKFARTDSASGVTVWGAPDAIFRLADGSFLVADYKTARITTTQDAMYPMYKAQLNAYVYIGEVANVCPVSKIALLYFEPETENSHASDPANQYERGFRMAFSCKPLEVDLEPQLVTLLMREAAEIATLPNAPPAISGCSDCPKLELLALESASLDSGAEGLLALLALGRETDRLEFKSSVSWDLDNDRFLESLRDECVIAICAFLNHEGGDLVIGVSDDLSIVGLRRDLSHYGGRDGIVQAIENVCGSQLSPRPIGLLGFEFVDVGSQSVLRVKVKRDPSRVYVFREKVYVRRNAGSKPALTPQEIAYWSANRRSMERK